MQSRATQSYRHHKGPETVTIWRLRPAPNSWVDPWGLKLDVTEIVEELTLTRTDDTYEFSNGYETATSPVYVSPDGHRFYQHVSIDYHNNTSYRPIVPDTVQGRWVHRLSPTVRYVRNGQPVVCSPNGKPDGPPAC